MKNIDLKDRKILYELFLNSRQSFAKIGKKVGLHRNNVSYRINKLKEKGFIKSFITHIDPYKLGFTVIRIYLSFQNINPKTESEIINFIKNDKNNWFVGSMKGRFELAVLICVKEIHEFNSFWNELLSRYRYYLKENYTGIFCYLHYYKPIWLLPNKINKDLNIISFIVTDCGKKVDFDELDRNILNLISNNSRIGTNEIAQILKKNKYTIKNRLDNFKKKDIIRGYSIDIDFRKLGLLWYKVFINLLDYTKRKQIIQYLEKKKSIYYLCKQTGFADIEIAFLVENNEQFFEYIDEIFSKFPNTIKDYYHIYATPRLDRSLDMSNMLKY